MIHGLFYRRTPRQHQPAIVDGSHPLLNIDPVRQRIITWSNQQCWLAESRDKHNFLHTNAAESEFGVAPHLRIVAWARLDNRTELGGKLNVTSSALTKLSDRQLILRAYLRFGEECTNHLFGDFCFAIYDSLAQKIICVRDQMGTKPFYYYLDDHVFAFSSSLSLFHILDEVTVKPCMEWASKFLIANMSMDFRKTAYHRIFKLPPAHQLMVMKHSLREHCYFEFHTNKIELNTSGAYVELYREQLERAIKCRVQTEHPLGSEISGGMDSSTVTAYAAKFFAKNLSDFYTFGFVYFEHEPQYILQVNQHYNISNAYICCYNNANLYQKTRALQALGAPVEHGNASSHEIFYDMAAKHQVRTLLSGFGGDEFVTSLHGHLYLYELLKNKKHGTLYHNLLGNPFMRALRLARLYYSTDQQGGKKSHRMRAAYDSRWPDVIVTEKLIHAYAIEEEYMAIGDFDNGYCNLDQFTLEQRWVPFVATRMENCTLMAATYGIDYRWPLLDTQLIQCFLSIPSAEKYHRGVGRYLHKRAIAGVVPSDIVWKQGKYMGKSTHTSTSVGPSLNQDLHPDLLPLLNMDKLKKQCSRLRQTQEKQAFQLKRNVNKINQLDNWLKYYFATGCDWENTPEHRNVT